MKQYRIVFSTTNNEREKKLKKLNEKIEIWVAKNKGKTKLDWLLEKSVDK